jgi:hypothetical protein
MRRSPGIPAVAASLAVVAALLAASGCGGSDDTTPVACLGTTGSYLHALEAAPGDVRLDGEVPISGCLIENQKAGDLVAVGLTMLRATIVLNSTARQDPGGKHNLQLGYLIGAAQRGADSSEGIHAELIRRLSTAARYSPDNRPLPPAFRHAYREGFDAGHANG